MVVGVSSTSGLASSDRKWHCEPHAPEGLKSIASLSIHDLKRSAIG